MLSNRSVTSLELGSNSISDRAAKPIADMIAQNDTLHGLSLFKNSLLGGAAKVFPQRRQIKLFSIP